MMDLLFGQKKKAPPAEGAELTIAGNTANAKTGSVDVTLANFEQEVVKASMTQPVIIDFWASWCGPCQQLMPLLEKVVAETKGAVKLVKVNADQNPELCQMMRVQSLPTVFALFQGRPVDAFMGAVPESEIRRFVGQLAQMAGGELTVDALLAEAGELLNAGEFEAAEAAFAGLMEEAPDMAKARAGLVRALVKQNRLDEARAIIGTTPTAQSADPDIIAAAKAIEVAEEASNSGPIGELLARWQSNPQDYQTGYDLAIALYAAGRIEESFDTLLDIIKKDRTWNEEAARKQLVKYFEVLGPMDPITIKARRKLSTMLFS